jgi:DNA invertase Pin-like site-specific DNA recombinase
VGHGERRQHEAAMRFVETHGLPVAETLQDIGVSALRGDNALTGELGRFVQRIEHGEIPSGSVLDAESLDRLTRNRVNDALLLRLKITQNGVRIGLTAQNVILDLASYAAFFPTLADMMRSNSESEHKSFRSLANWQTKRKLAKAGVLVTSQVPRWLEVRDGKIHVLEERVQLVRRIFEMYVGGYGRGVIARTLIKEGVPAWNTRKPVWHESHVDKLLCNRVVAGDVHADKPRDAPRLAEVVKGRALQELHKTMAVAPIDAPRADASDEAIVHDAFLAANGADAAEQRFRLRVQQFRPADCSHLIVLSSVPIRSAAVLVE